jgi:hypothetical protein
VDILDFPATVGKFGKSGKFMILMNFQWKSIHFHVKSIQNNGFSLSLFFLAWAGSISDLHPQSKVMCEHRC